MKVSIDLGKCCGHARCNAVEAENFLLDESGYALQADVELPPGKKRRPSWPSPGVRSERSA